MISSIQIALRVEVAEEDSALHEESLPQWYGGE